MKHDLFSDIFNFPSICVIFSILLIACYGLDILQKLTVVKLELIIILFFIIYGFSENFKCGEIRRKR